jgi:hypothetical protein
MEDMKLHIVTEIPQIVKDRTARIARGSGLTGLKGLALTNYVALECVVTRFQANGKGI